ncbi:MAG: hypothetical protein HND48_13060 [Chloroflexi bacterium]|nr:hypothetical protein [Chloroflexota bacterium]
MGVNGVAIPIQPWTPVDSEAWIKAMQWNLGTGLQDQDRSYAYEALSDEGVRCPRTAVPVRSPPDHRHRGRPADLGEGASRGRAG